MVLPTPRPSPPPPVPSHAHNPSGFPEESCANLEPHEYHNFTKSDPSVYGIVLNHYTPHFCAGIPFPDLDQETS
jgi:hypothetical protein